MLLVRRPYHLSDEEADRWMRSEAKALTGVPDVERVEVSRLLSPAARDAREWDWLIELHFARAEDATRAARDEACRDLIGDLRLLGMRPRLVMVDGTATLEG